MGEARDLTLAPVQLELKVASRDLIRAYGGQDAAGELIGRRQSRYSDAGHANTATFLTIDEAATLEDHTVGAVGHPHITRVMARRQGYSLVRLPQAIPMGEDLVPFIGKLAKEFGEASSSACKAADAAQDRKAEARAAAKEFDDLIEVAVTMRAALRAIAEGDA